MTLTATPNVSGKPVRVMIVDDSALMRKLLAEVLSRSPEVEVVDVAMDGQFALEHLRKVQPDVVLLDLDMPRLDGLAALDRIVAEYALPVVMCSTHTRAGSPVTLDALARGAVDFIEKPSLAALTSGEASSDIIARVRGASNARVTPAQVRNVRRDKSPALPTAGAPVVTQSTQPASKQFQQLVQQSAPELIAIGISTGGPPALEQVLTPLPGDFSLGIAIVQHMPANFTSLLASHLNRVCQLSIREAADGDVLEPGVVLIAPGGAHMRIVRVHGQYQAAIDRNGALVGGHRPSADVLFDSVLAATQGRAAALLMTGMGSDGAAGLGRLAEAGALTIAQSPESCIISGMPKSAIDKGYARAVLPLEELAAAMMACGAKTHAAYGSGNPTLQ